MKSNSANQSSPSGDRGIIVTGAAGFIGSCMVQYLNEQGLEHLILVDDFGFEEKRKNWESKKFIQIVERYNLFEWLKEKNRYYRIQLCDTRRIECAIFKRHLALLR